MLTLFACLALSRTVLAPGRYEQNLLVGGIERHFILRIPESVDITRPAPLVVVLHGWMLSGKIAETYTEMSDQAERSGFIVAFPDGLGSPKGWNAGFIDLSGKRGDDVGFVSALLDKVESESRVDPNRLYVCGHSNGAFMTEEVGAKLGYRLAAIGVVAGTIGLSGDPSKSIPKPVAPISEIEIHSRADRLVAYDNSCSAAMRCVSAPEAAKWWATQDGCNLTPALRSNSDHSVSTTLYRGGMRGTEVELITLNRGSHDWPRRNEAGLDAAETLWDFFAAHPRRST